MVTLLPYAHTLRSDPLINISILPAAKGEGYRYENLGLTLRDKTSI